jgi:hypothetical protein
MQSIQRIRSHYDLLVIAVMFGASLGFLAAHFIHIGPRVASAYTPPHLEEAVPADANSLFIEADVDTRGRVWNYRILSNGRRIKDVSSEVKNSLIFTTFRPATYRGAPVSATAVFSFPLPLFEKH